MRVCRDGKWIRILNDYHEVLLYDQRKTVDTGGWPYESIHIHQSFNQGAEYCRQMTAIRPYKIPEENIYCDYQSGKDFDRPGTR